MEKKIVFKAQIKYLTMENRKALKLTKVKVKLKIKTALLARMALWLNINL